MAASTAYAAYLLGDGGRPSLAGPTFSALTDARAWCDARKSAGEWGVFALSAVVESDLPRPTRAFLLPVQGEPREFWIPAGEPMARIAMNKAVGGLCASLGVGREWPGRRGTYTLCVAHQPMGSAARAVGPANAVLGDFLIGPDSTDERVRGPVIIVRLQCHTAGENEDNADPDSDYLSIPADIQPSEWKTLLLEEEEGDKSAME